MEACELLTIELRLDRIEAELARELPPHLRSFAHAHAHRLAPPPAPGVLLRATTLATARAALAHPVLADRGLALLRLAAPIAIESDPGVRTARAAPPSWPALSALAAARDAAASLHFGRGAIELVHLLHGSAVDLGDLRAASAVDLGGPRGVAPVVTGEALPARRSPDGDGSRAPGSPPQAQRTGEAAGGRDHAALPPPVAGWFAPDDIGVDDAAIARAWDAICARHGIDGALRFERAAGARPRTFVVEPRREVIIALPARIATPAERFAVLHELGHAVAAFSLPAGLPRVVDEAVAAYTARAIERDADPWYSPLATAARSRRCALAERLDQIERALPAIPDPAARLAEHPPAALWHDPGAQAAYVAAEALADALDGVLGPWPSPGALATRTATWCEAIEHLTGAVG
jgi:hypothetical protein